MKTKRYLLLYIMMLVLASCAVEPQPIEYGKDACHFCKMNIVDKQHAAEYVTKKGKVYKFDAIECLLDELKDQNRNDIKFLLVNTYDAPAKLVDASSATYLISENLPSPMGAYLTAFETSKVATAVQKDKGGSLYDWETLNVEYYKNK